MAELGEACSVHASFLPDAPESDSDSGNAGEEGRVVCGLVATQTFTAVPLTIGSDYRMTVVDAAVEEVEDVAAENRSKRHNAPVLGEAINAKGMCDEGWIDPEEEAVRQSCSPGDENQLMGFGDRRASKLGHCEQDSGEEKAPEAGHVQLLHQQVGSDSWRPKILVCCA